MLSMLKVICIWISNLLFVYRSESFVMQLFSPCVHLTMQIALFVNFIAELLVKHHSSAR